MITGWQFWAGISIPALLALVGILQNQCGVDNLGRRIDRLEDRVDKLADTLHQDVQGLLGMIGDHAQRIVRIEERIK